MLHYYAVLLCICFRRILEGSRHCGAYATEVARVSSLKKEMPCTLFMTFLIAYQLAVYDG